MKKYQVLGVMSGTSVDGVDLAFVRFSEKEEGQWTYEVQAAATLDYDEEWESKLQGAVQLSAVDLLVLNNSYGGWLGNQVKAFLEAQELEKPDFIASHGHTVYHQIDKGMTYQLGSGYHLSQAAGCRVVADFRSLDVALGGEGAPLVPIADEYLFGQFDFCLNLGGIANVSYKQGDLRRAFDIGLSNMLLNHLTQASGMKYDAGGALARSGSLSKGYFEQLNALPYFQLPSPKSTGFEWFADEILPIAEQFNHLSLADALHTVVHHVAFQVAESINGIGQNGRIMVTGGGAKNDFMIDLIREYAAAGLEVVVPDQQIVAFKEAIAFGLMGVLRMEGKVNCFASVTGASSNTSGGIIFEVA
ncbi:MAG: anhydro-N-acetylmuramic acid kinase [Bacteroidota bacterium]